jgi:hypothetical protein
LCNKNDNNYLYDLAPDYVQIAFKVSGKNLGKFRNAIAKSSFREKELKTKLYLYYLKQVSNRDAIEQLFRVLNVKSIDGNFLNLLKSVVHTRDISLVEVHRMISLRSSMSYDDGYTWRTNGKEISDLLLNLNYIENRSLLFYTENIFFTENDIKEGYEKEIIDLEKNSSLFLRNQHLTSS